VLRQLETIKDELLTEEMQNMKTGFRKVELADVKIGECIGVGAFGKVWRDKENFLSKIDINIYSILS